MYKKTCNKKYLDIYYNSVEYARAYENIKKKWKAKAEIAIDLMNLKQGMKVLDIGCASKMLKPYVEKRNAKYTGLDISKNFRPDILADAEDLSVIKDNEYDWVIYLDVLEHLPTPEIALKEAHRIGKNIIIAVPNWYQFNCLPFLPSHPNDRHLIKKTPFGWIKLINKTNFTIKFIRGFYYIPNLAFRPGLGLQKLSKLFHNGLMFKISDYIDNYLASTIFFKYLGQELIIVAYKKSGNNNL